MKEIYDFIIILIVTVLINTVIVIGVLVLNAIHLTIIEITLCILSFIAGVSLTVLFLQRIYLKYKKNKSKRRRK